MMVVAEAVAVEPVSASKFPDMRESAGNFCNLQGISPCDASERTARSGGYGQNSLCNGSANFSQRIRDFGSTSSEFAAAGKSPVVLCFSGPIAA
jgi:hypothetical protein